MIDKAELLEVLCDQVTADLESLERRQRDTQEGATHEESRAEHAKDTRATEQGYLARGLAERVTDLRRTLTALTRLELRDFEPGDSIAVSALVLIASQDDAVDVTTRETWFLVPGAGGLELEDSSERIRTLTPASPLGRTLLGLGKGDEGTVHTPRGQRTLKILEIR
ncbi:MAG: hypothetical protein CL933_23140 [Deltaproteobacteria bacterium]|nr:hypothetical protein [Deltaproteobacteria bacterium]